MGREHATCDWFVFDDKEMSNVFRHVLEYFHGTVRRYYTIRSTGCKVGKLPELKIPWDELSEDALLGIIEEFVTREGTEYGDFEVSLRVKCEQVKQHLRNGEAYITFDEELQTCSISPAN